MAASASARQAGTTPRAAARGTASSIRCPRTAQRGFDELRFYAERFNTVEVNSTFYGQPRPQVSLGWVRRTPPGFEFSVKLYPEVHAPGASAPRITTSGQRPGRRRRVQGRHRAAGGRRDGSGALLAQFPPASRTRPRRATISPGCCATFARLPAGRRAAAQSLERRRRRDVFDLLDAHGAAWAQIDEPKFRSSIRQDLRAQRRRRSTTCGCTAGTPRSGGSTSESEDRYNYLYSEAELAPIAQKAA